ncbi:MAG TPA: HEAT repeat domain-containing protein [Acidimicrobiales bacterium]|nr:HEAT repeat domain-containing protein [Acidimicrobiales bacterium]
MRAWYRQRPWAVDLVFHAQSAFNDNVLRAAKSCLRSLGFRGTGLRYYQREGEYELRLRFLKSVHNTSSSVEFTIEMAAYYGHQTETIWATRIGGVLPMLSEHWWKLHAEEDVQRVTTEVVDAIKGHASPAFAALLRVPGLPGTTLARIWPRSFAGQTAALTEPYRDAPSRRLPLWREALVQATLVRLLSDSQLVERLSSSAWFRHLVVCEILGRGLQNEGAMDVVLDRLEHDPDPGVRASVARAYGSLALSDEVVDRLSEAAQEDEDLEVRWSATYAIDQRERYGPGWVARGRNAWWFDARPTGVPDRELPAELLDKIPAEAVRRGMTVAELTARALAGLPGEDPLTAYLRGE